MLHHLAPKLINNVHKTYLLRNLTKLIINDVLNLPHIRNKANLHTMNRISTRITTNGLTESNALTTRNFSTGSQMNGKCGDKKSDGGCKPCQSKPEPKCAKDPCKKDEQSCSAADPCKKKADSPCGTKITVIRTTSIPPPSSCSPCNKPPKDEYCDSKPKKVKKPSAEKPKWEPCKKENGNGKDGKCGGGSNQPSSSPKNPPKRSFSTNNSKEAPPSNGIKNVTNHNMMSKVELMSKNNMQAPPVPANVQNLIYGSTLYTE